MNNLDDKARALADWSHEMKRDWNERARHDAKWFIYPRGFLLSDEAFDATGASEVEHLVREDIDLLAGGRDPASLVLLELGCGIGRMTGHLARLFREIYATDVSGEMIHRAQRRLEQLQNVHFTETNGYDFADLPNESVDLAFSAFVFQHVPSTEIISASLRDAFRVLRTGGVFKFQTNSLTSFDFEEIEKDTWMGASYSEPLIRAFAAETDAQLVSINGAGSQYCWTILRKRQPGAPRQYAVAAPRIVFRGCTHEPNESRVPVTGQQASLTLLAAGLNLEAVDCNSVTIDISGLEVAPYYVGPLRSKFLEKLPLEFRNIAEQLVRVDLSLPVGAPAGLAEISLSLPSGETSPPVKVEFIVPAPIIPRIGQIMNGADETPEICSHGAKSLLRLYVEGLDETADPGNIRIQIGKRIVKPCYVGSLPGQRMHRIDTQLPRDISLGPIELRLYFGNLASPVEMIEVRSE